MSSVGFLNSFRDLLDQGGNVLLEDLKRSPFARFVTSYGFKRLDRTADSNDYIFQPRVP